MAFSRISALADKRILVTGGHGFLGKHVVRLLKDAGAQIIAPTSDQIDLTSREDVFTLPFDSPDMVFHLAARVSGIRSNMRAPFDYLSYNSLMAANIVEYALRHQIPIVAAGSVCVYSNKADLPFREAQIFHDWPERTNFGYGLAKRFLLQTLMAAEMQDTSFRYAYLVSANLYGPGDNFGEGSHVIPDMIRKIGNSPLTQNQVRVLGSGKTTRDFLYVEDAAKAYVMAGEYLLEDGIKVIANIGSGQEIDVLSVARLIASIYGYEVQFVSDGSGIDGQPRRIVDLNVAYRNLGWIPRTRLIDGLSATVDYYKERMGQHARGEIPKL